MLKQRLTWIMLIVLTARCQPTPVPPENGVVVDTASTPLPLPSPSITPTPTPTFQPTGLPTGQPGSTSTPAAAPIVCGTPTGSPGPPIVYNVDGDDLTGQFTSQITTYLNRSGSATGLKQAIEAATDEQLPITAEVIPADMTGDGQIDILTHINLVWGPTFAEILSLFACDERGYTHLDSVTDGNFYNASPAAIETAIDLNHNALPDIVVRRPTVEGTKGFQTLIIYEWNGHSLTPVLTLGPNYGAFGQVILTDHDHDPTTLELTIPYFYAYEEETATNVIEYSLVRPIEMIYGWDGSAYSLKCQYFSERSTLRLTILHTAETQGACGLYDSAMGYYQQLLDDVDAEAWPEYTDIAPPLVYPASLDSEEQRIGYASDLERAYLQAFAGYRLVQLALIDNWPELAQDRLEHLRNNYKPGEHGYTYAAMAAALLANYDQTGDFDLACRAAAQAFEDTRAGGEDPGIIYRDDPVIEFGFYFTNMRQYGSNPDDLFTVPDEIDSMVSIPICLQPAP